MDGKKSNVVSDGTMLWVRWLEVHVGIPRREQAGEGNKEAGIVHLPNSARIA